MYVFAAFLMDYDLIRWEQIPSVGWTLKLIIIQPMQESQFDIFDWYPKFQACLQHFLDHGQHSKPVQAVAAFVNIRLPAQRGLAMASDGAAASNRNSLSLQPSVIVVPYIRRLVATGFDSPAVLHGFFGDEWPQGIGAFHESERRNYLFASKSDNWLKVKNAYDMEDGQTIPFLRPLQNVTEKEIEAAETSWSEWLAVQDWMLGPRAPGAAGNADGV
ncbi:hypothetical protein S7711_07598 [Stachybotrys chartarum IBT 7711]|uniref:Ilp is an apoptosis inhibitor n=1 Tax=Stachybotrys chartarum (strain CBS 109288 / IBT 7711) TaxID=1280523 RepID=A0A084AQ09_STACB|nr:hypothetical protein S7711_07598 [Stachybotrys chartarum IBT 7711]KFA47030.1 hypothetical protein S40293_04597 [Stachybotrys chartarum IBT 40293]KFA75445.1 hypothetical protein S40288_01150 [Stachybotrys chartarum IBT 40288]